MYQGSAAMIESLRQIVAARHVYYEVTPDIASVSGERRRVGYDLTLWASHEKGARALPGCRKCMDILADLYRIADWVVGGGEAGVRWELQPFDRALHGSSQFPSIDEIDLSLKLLHRDLGDEPVDGSQERALLAARRRLAEVGVHEGIWRPASAGPHRH